MPEIKGSSLHKPLISNTLLPDLGGGKRDRTADPLLAKQVLFQLSYTPVISQKPETRIGRWWA
jgi:hypothetical protein